MASDFVHQYGEVIEDRKPLCFATQIRLQDWDEHYKFEASLRLPFTGDGDNVSWILSVDHYADDWSDLMQALGVADVPRPLS